MEVEISDSDDSDDDKKEPDSNGIISNINKKNRTLQKYIQS